MLIQTLSIVSMTKQDLCYCARGGKGGGKGDGGWRMGGGGGRWGSGRGEGLELKFPAKSF